MYKQRSNNPVEMVWSRSRAARFRVAHFRAIQFSAERFRAIPNPVMGCGQCHWVASQLGDNAPRTLVHLVFLFMCLLLITELGWR